ncbi:MAG TPA: putative Ig domain-containing protein [Blastocatellia bacterium]|nr:putative Ig domain-containing protein [Blastocatellia bacterium]HMY74153.1 putative Ig domain-containing protein [Blastocatellia bacterium]HMZ22241.1 putative Ig domain-containing protein [Blastocatellia bacterium]
MLLLMFFSGAVWAQTPPGTAFPNTSELSDQKLGSILVYNYITAGGDPATQNTELNLTNTHPTTPVTVRLFLVRETGRPISFFVTLAPRQTAGYLVSDLLQGFSVNGYAVAVAVNSATGCPINFNHLAGDAFIKLSAGQRAGLQAVAIAAIAASPATCSGGSTTLNFDGTSYNKLPRVLSLNNIPSRVDGNDTLLIVNRIGGDLTSTMATVGTLFGLISDDAENSLSFSLSSSSSQLRGILSDAFPRLTPRFTIYIPAGRSGWLRVYSLQDNAYLGATLNFNASAGSSANAYNNGQNLTHRTLTVGGTTLTMLVSPPPCTNAIAPAGVQQPSSGGSGSVTITAFSDCLWTATSNAAWITITSAANGAGNGILNYSAAANPGTTPRTGTLTVAGQTFTVTQAGNCPVITINPATLTSARVGVPSNQTLTASGGVSPYTFAITAGSLPIGMSLSSSGVLSGVPAQPATYSFTVRATGSNGCAGIRSYQLVVIPACNLTINPASLPAGIAGTPYSQTLTAGGGGAPYTFALSDGALPGGLSLSAGGALTGTPTTAGTFTFSVRGRDSALPACTGERRYTVTINPGGNSPRK